MTTRVVHVRREPFDVYIGRRFPFGKDERWKVTSPFANPYTVRQYGIAALDLHWSYFLRRVESEPEFRAQVLALRGLVLGCWCKPGPCHGDSIAEFVDGQEDG